MSETTDRRHGRGRRDADGRGFVVEPRANWYRDAWSFVISIVLLYAVVAAVNAGDRARRAAAVATANVAAIEQNRIDILRQNCIDQNARNSAAVAEFHALVKTARAGERRWARVIDALAPVRDCAAAVAAIHPSQAPH